MSDPCLSSLVRLSPGFTTAVDLMTDLENSSKVGAFIPTEQASEVLLDMAENLHVSAGRRSRVIAGTYGTGKSHLALVLARLYRDGSEADPLRPVMEKMTAKWPGKASKLAEERGQHPGKFLLVPLNGDQLGAFDEALLRALDDALGKHGLDDVMPITAFSAAVKRIDDLKQSHPQSSEKLREEGKRLGYESVAVLRGQLQAMETKAYDDFRELHKQVCAGAPFFTHYAMSPGDVYAATAKELVGERGYAGIVVVWDEFGRYMERVVDDPRGLEGQGIQDFAQRTCNNSHKNQIHLYLICHRSLQDYVRISMMLRATRMSSSEEEEWKKIGGRFRQFDMVTTDQEVFELIDQVIVQGEGDSAWKVFASRFGDYFDAWTDDASRLRIFPEFDRQRIHEIVTVGAYPLHPMTSFSLPKISECVAQNERTMFQFLSDSGSDTLGPFVGTTKVPKPDMPPPCLPADALWTFFGRDVADHPIHRRVVAKLHHAEAHISPDDLLAKRIVRVIALLTVIGSDRAPCVEDVIAYSLALPAAERSALSEELKRLCSKTQTRERLLVQNIRDGAFRFTGAASDDFDGKVEEAVEERSSIVSPGKHLRTIAQELQLDSYIEASAYMDDFFIRRGVDVEFVTTDEVENPEQWVINLGGGGYRDGYALVVLCEDTAAIRRTKELADGPLRHAQIMVGVPESPVRLSALLRRHESIRHLERSQSHLYGEGAELRDEWEQQDRDHLDALAGAIGPLLEPQNRGLEWFANGIQLKGVTSRSRLSNAVSEMMRNVFPLTPPIAHDRLTTDEGRDSFVAARRAIIDKLLLPDGADLLAKETSKQLRTVVEFVYRKNGILHPSGKGHVVSQPDTKRHPQMSAVWDAVMEQVEKAKDEPVGMACIVGALRRPPFGLRLRSISLLTSAVFRPFIHRGNLSLEPRRGGSAATRVVKLDGRTLDSSVIAADSYNLVYTDIGEKHEAILLGVARAFGLDPDPECDKSSLMTGIHDTIVKWWRGLPQFALRTMFIKSENTCALRDQILLRLATAEGDAQDVLLNELPSAILPKDGVEKVSWEAVCELFSRVKDELDTAVERYLAPLTNEAVSAVYGGEKPLKDAGKNLARWYKNLPKERQDLRIPGDSSSVVIAARAMVDKDADSSAVLADLAKRITGTPLEDWNDEMLQRFRGRLESAKDAVEKFEAADIKPSGSGDAVTVPTPKPGRVSIVICDDKDAFRRTFVLVNDVSVGGDNLRKIIQGAIEGIGRSLPAGECETILLHIIRNVFK